jgi:hypothetical protein
VFFLKAKPFPSRLLLKMSAETTTPTVRRTELTPEEEKQYPFQPLTQEEVNTIIQFVAQWATSYNQDLTSKLKEYDLANQTRVTRQEIVDALKDFCTRLQAVKTDDIRAILDLPNLPPRQVAVSDFRPQDTQEETVTEHPEEEEEDGDDHDEGSEAETVATHEEEEEEAPLKVQKTDADKENEGEETR